MTPEEFKKFKDLMKDLPTAWPEWKEYFEKMDMKIPKHSEKAYFYMDYINQCITVNGANLLVRSLTPYEAVFEKSFNKIVDIMENHIKEYREKNRIVVNDSYGEHNNTDKGIVVANPLEEQFNAMGNRIAEARRRSNEEEERSHEDRVKNFYGEMQVKEKEKKKAEDTKQGEINTVKEFDKHIQNLNNAKTKRNSKEYEDIIKAVEWVNRTTTFEKGKDLTVEQRYATKLLVIKNSINKYIEHKAKKGVNKNIGDKLAVVEALNVEVSKKLERLKGKIDPFIINGKDINLNNIPITKYQEYMKANKANPDGKLPFPAPNMPHATDDCMQRIIIKAVEMKHSPAHIEDLHNMRDVLDKIEISKPKQTEQSTPTPTPGGPRM